MRRTLAAFKPFPERVSDVLELVRYTYAHTKEDDLLRDLVAESAVCLIENLERHSDWRPLLEEVGAFAVEVLAKIVARLD